MDDLSWTPAHEIRDAVANREVSAIEVTTACLDRIESVDPTLRSFITVAGEQALADAARADRAVADGEALGPLHGVPVALKDEAWVAGMRCTAGSLLFSRFVPARDGTVAERLRRAGAIIVGKTNMPEFAAWPRSVNRVTGEAVNPWDHGRISGASSGGSAAAVATGLVPIAIGSDGGGSTRIPSALCGTIGLYPTPGRVPSYGSFSYVPEGSLGPIARDVLDVAIVEQVIAGPDSRDAAALTARAPDVLTGLDDGVRGLRIALSPDFGWIQVDPRLVAAVERAVSVLADAGASVETTSERIPHPWGDGAMLAGLQAAVAEVTWDLSGSDADAPDLGAEAWMWDVFGGTVPFTATDEFRALCRRHLHLLTPSSQLMFGADAPAGPPPGLPGRDELWAPLRGLLGHHDVICSPTMAFVAPPIPDGWGSPYPDPFMGTNFTFIANSTHCSAASVPCGFVDGLPVGLQIIAPPGDEATVLRVARAFTTAQPFTHPLIG